MQTVNQYNLLLHKCIHLIKLTDKLNPFTEDDDATDADEMTTFDGSTISLSLSPIMTPAKQGN